MTDEAVRYFWQVEFPQIKGNPQSSIVIRLDTFLRQKLIRNIVCQKDKVLDFRKIMDGNKIFLAKLSQGIIGQENSYLLGTFLLSKLQQIALSRQDTSNRPFFSIYADEAHHLICPTISTLLSGIRKFRVGLSLFLQQYKQIQSKDAEVASSVLTNCATRLCFRLGDEDATRFEKGFSFFTAEHLRNLSIGEALGRVERADYDFNLKIPLVPKVDKDIAEQRKQAVLQSSREQFATPKAEVEAQLFGNQSQVSKPIPIPKIEVKNFDDLRAEQVEPSAILIPKPTPLEQPNDGKGGTHHKELQAVIKRVAENYGFVVEIEKSILDSAGSIDVSLEKENLKIACEVSVTSTADYEVKNVLKCLSADYDYVCVIVSNQKKIPALKTKLNAEIPINQQEKVKVFSLTGLLAFLSDFNSPKESNNNKSQKTTGQRLNFTEACEFLSVSPSALYRWIREGKVPFYRVGREYRFDRDELVLIGKQDLLGKKKVAVNLSPLKIEKSSPKSKKEQNSRYRKLLNLD